MLSCLSAVIVAGSVIAAGYESSASGRSRTGVVGATESNRIADGYESSAFGRSRTGVVGATESKRIASVFETGVRLPARSVPVAEYVHVPWRPSAPRPPAASG